MPVMRTQHPPFPLLTPPSPSQSLSIPPPSLPHPSTTTPHFDHQVKILQSSDCPPKMTISTKATNLVKTFLSFITVGYHLK